MKKFLSLFLSLAILVSSFAFSLEAFAGGSFSSATRILQNSSTYYYFNDYSELYYYFIPSSSGQYTISASRYNHVRLYNSDKELIKYYNYDDEDEWDDYDEGEWDYYSYNTAAYYYNDAYTSGNRVYFKLNMSSGSKYYIQLSYEPMAPDVDSYLYISREEDGEDDWYDDWDDDYGDDRGDEGDDEYGEGDYWDEDYERKNATALELNKANKHDGFEDYPEYYKFTLSKSSAFMLYTFDGYGSATLYDSEFNEIYPSYNYEDYPYYSNYDHDASWDEVFGDDYWDDDYWDDDEEYYDYNDASALISRCTLKAGTYYIKLSSYDDFTFYPVTPVFIEDTSITLDKYTYYYTGSNITPNVNVYYLGNKLTKGKDYTTKYYSNKYAGTGYIEINGINSNHSYGTRYIKFYIKDHTYDVTIPKSTYTYTGSAIKPVPTVKIDGKTVSSNYYTVSYSNNVSAGTASVKVTGKNGYSFSKTVNFKIAKTSISNCSISISKKSYTYDGTAKKPTVTVKYNGSTVSTSNYSIQYSNNVNAGTAKVIITGKNKYTGQKTITYTIAKNKLSNYSVSISKNSYTYDGTAKKPTVTVKYKGNNVSSSNYKVKYSNNVNAGTAKVTITGKGNITGSKTFTYKINKTKLLNCSVSISKNSYKYDGKAKKPSVSVKVNGKSVPKSAYKIKYSNNVNAGTAKVTITGKGNVAGTKTIKFKIAPIKLPKCEIDNFLYDGKTKSPIVWSYKNVKEWSEYDQKYYTNRSYFKLKKTDYNIKFSKSPKDIGSYTATITLKGNYTGKHTVKFKILPKDVKEVKISNRTTTSISARWSKVPGAQGYKIYRYNTKKSKYTLYKTQKGTSITVSRANSSDISVDIYVVAYKKVNGKTYTSSEIYGSDYLKPSKVSIKVSRTNFGAWETYFPDYGYYDYQVSTTSNFSYIYSSWRGYTKTIYSHDYPSGVTFYVRARRYIYNKNGNLEVGPWSDVKKVTPY